MKFDLSVLADCVQGQLYLANSDKTINPISFDQVSSDSRQSMNRALFVALVGDRFDGHLFLAQAKTNGAVCALVEKLSFLEENHISGVVVPDTKQALAKLARFWRQQFDIPIVAVVGSNGKTTVKEMVRTALQSLVGENHVCSTQGNLNNDIGVPLSVLSLRKQHLVAVFELGMNHPGETSLLADIVRPTVAVINNAQREHQEFMKDVEAVANEHALILDEVRNQGVAVLPRDDAFFSFWKNHLRSRDISSRVIDFSVKSSNSDALVRVLSIQEVERGQQISCVVGQQVVDLCLPMLGVHHVANAMAALAVVSGLGLDVTTAADALSHFETAKGRMVVHRLGLVTLIDDTYNANPDSVRAAIDALAKRDGERTLILGDMGEVGEQGPDFHREIGCYARENQVLLWGVGSLSKEAVKAHGQGRCFESMDDLLKEVGLQKWSGTLLIKGSRFMKMERVVSQLLG